MMRGGETIVRMCAVSTPDLRLGSDLKECEAWGLEKLHRWMRRCMPDVPYEVDRIADQDGRVWLRARENVIA